MPRPPPPSAVEIVHYSWNLFIPIESFSQKDFYDLQCVEKQKQKYRIANTQMRALAHTHQITMKCWVTKDIRVTVTGHRGNESSASRVIHHPRVHRDTGQKCWFSSALADLSTETASKCPTTCDTIQRSGTSNRKHNVWRRYAILPTSKATIYPGRTI